MTKLWPREVGSAKQGVQHKAQTVNQFLNRSTGFLGPLFWKFTDKPILGLFGVRFESDKIQKALETKGNKFLKRRTSSPH